MNKVVIVTGGSRGIGAATSLTLAKKGYKIAINYLNDEVAATSVYEQIKKNNGQSILVKADVSKEDGVSSLFKIVNAQFGEVTHLVNNVGILFEKMAFTGISAQRMMKVLETNVLSAFNCAKAFVEQNM
jgi:NAD(P)-dependent dehydrogenase (short-subunit alcohol dehydrogenase family)